MSHPGKQKGGSFDAAAPKKINWKDPSDVIPGHAKHRTRNLEIPGLVLRTIPE
jgi:hypothetical protein